MQLDLLTVSVTSISVAAIVGLLLLFAWSRDPENALVGWWGLAQLLMAAGVLIAVIALQAENNALHAIGQAWIILSSAIMWMALRQFEGRRPSVLWVVVWPAAFLIAQQLGAFDSFDTRLIATCAVLALLSFLAAGELSREGSEPLASRWPASFLLMAMGVGFLAWVPLIMQMPIRAAGLVFASTWFPVTILVATLGRMALAFLMLSLVKERQELKQRIDALTDALTGLPNRRALFEAADRLAEHSRYLKGDPISVLVFDLDHFKKINDTYGHRLGDRVLQRFATTMADNLPTGSILGRLGGEEFAAILPGADLETSVLTAELIRTAFQTSAAVIDGVAVRCTVSVGAASHDDIDCDLPGLFHRADGALYSAKNAGRNRVETALASESDFSETLGLPEAHDSPHASSWVHFRRYRHRQVARPPRARRHPMLS
jgi:diguanylate cyclase (GGDEF)-like protein